ncbi:uncharacterized protein LOC106155164 [Lingula anatina]|uniref:Uncharacterized protein LOC106155164 n=1 Tax=Lingula anatina TaxID=7574 RepID=A0A2R2MIL7_LINAN|nr:uncharacterized protein LOC106155164 [Lingula anatina]|eukprot:XP_023930070.1 uncharacterized protein LOC106155164 [Lingula anatina]
MKHVLLMFGFLQWTAGSILAPLPSYLLYPQGDKPDKTYSRKCDKKCPYGYESDVEGVSLCQCHNPCSSVMCLDGFQCVVQKPKLCNQDFCRYFASCKDVNVCALTHLDNSHQCTTGMTRWYYDQKTGKCRRFFGCRGKGNNFSRKWECKRKCHPKFAGLEVPPRIRNKLKRRKHSRKVNRERINNRPSFHSTRQEEAKKDLSTPVMEYKAKTLELQFPTCPPDAPFQQCPIHPCSHCRNRNIICIPNFCGKCGAFYLHLQTGKMLERCSVPG